MSTITDGLDRLLAAVMAGPPTIPVDIPPLADLEATDVTLWPDLETVDVGPIGDTYLRLAAPDLVVAVSEARRVLDEIERVVLDARQDQADAERVLCPFCRTVIEDEEPTCGAASCRRELGREMAAEAIL